MVRITCILPNERDLPPWELDPSVVVNIFRFFYKNSSTQEMTTLLYTSLSPITLVLYSIILVLYSIWYRYQIPEIETRQKLSEKRVYEIATQAKRRGLILPNERDLLGS